MSVGLSTAGNTTHFAAEPQQKYHLHRYFDMKCSMHEIIKYNFNLLFIIQNDFAVYYKFGIPKFNARHQSV